MVKGEGRRTSGSGLMASLDMEVGERRDSRMTWFHDVVVRDTVVVLFTKMGSPQKSSTGRWE